ncbi:MAG: hypothetical protein UHU21_16080 [Lachnospiraceae bacterium]|nr:hypothetical protein [Lachnospiraceae bacterium]
MSLVIDHKVVKTTSVIIDGKEYKIPLLSQMSLKEVQKMRKAAEKGDDATLDWGIGYIKQFIPAAIVDSLTVENITDIMDEIKLQTTNNGDNLGES